MLAGWLAGAYTRGAAASSAGLTRVWRRGLQVTEPESPRSSYAQHVPVLDDQYTKEPPSAPSHL